MSGTQQLLFIHGAGGYIEDRRIADELAAAADRTVLMPQLPDTDMSFEGWAGPVREYLAGVAMSDVVVAHSFGASVLLRVLAERTGHGPTRAVLLAMPNWGPRGWDVAEYAFDGPGPDVALSLHHCRDDEVVPFDHLDLNFAELRSAKAYVYPSGGHQFEGIASEVWAHVHRGW